MFGDMEGQKKEGMQTRFFYMEPTPLFSPLTQRTKANLWHWQAPISAHSLHVRVLSNAFTPQSLQLTINAIFKKVHRTHIQISRNQTSQPL